MTKATVFYAGLKENLALPANHFVITGEPVSDDENSVLHWQIYIVSSDSAATILDMIPGADTRTGVLLVTGVDHCSSANARSQIKFEAVEKVTAQEICNKLVELGRERYKYTDDGSGCRFWCQTVLGDLVNGGYVHPDAMELFDAVVAERNAAFPAVYPLPTRQGLFY